jgi:3-methyladenine DNA glycosylase AlkC
MPEPFKNRFSKPLIEQMAACFSQHYCDFDERAFISKASANLSNLELKQRSMQIVEAMRECLPEDFTRCGDILHNSLRPMVNVNELSKDPSHARLIAGWAIMPMADFVGIYGQSHFEYSLTLLRAMTQRFSAEFAIRYFLDAKPQQTLAVLQTWLEDESEHVRRLVSEGTRPRLPWGMQLKQFVADPHALLPLLETLKDDSSEYVRRSVANNLNDIAKDHPALVVEICQRWLRDSTHNRTRLIKHACRTLFKQGRPDALDLFSFKFPKLSACALSLDSKVVEIGEAIEMKIELSASSNKSKQASQKMMLDYAVYHQKANGSLVPKVFKWKQFKLIQGESLQLSKKHSFKSVTTRKYYAGAHKITVLINGHELSECSFHLVE